MRRKVSKMDGFPIGPMQTRRRRRSRRMLVEELEARLTPSGSTAHFAVIGDYAFNTTAEQNVANLVNSWNPDFVITVGDNNYLLPLSAATYDQAAGQYYHNYIYPYTGSYGAGATTNNFYPTIGDHDWLPAQGGIQPYESFFSGLPGNQRYYQFSRGPVDFFAIDSNTFEPDGTTSVSVQAQWLKSALAASTAPWKLVYDAYPPYSSGAETVPELNWPFQAWGATALLSGHEHYYERLSVNGFPYFIDGSGGQGLESTPTFFQSTSAAFYNANYGAMLLDASSSQITFKFVNTSGTVIDSYAINYALPAAPSNVTSTQVAGTQTNVTWTVNANNATGYMIERSTDGTSYTQIATVGPTSSQYLDSTVPASGTYYYRVTATSAGGNSAPAAAPGLRVVKPLATADGSPTGLTGTVASSSEIDLAWTDTSGGAASFIVTRSSDGTNYTQIAAPAAGTTSYADGGLAPGTYYYQVTGVLGSSSTSPTAVVSAALAPAAPTNLTATVASSRQINLSWTNNASNATGFNILQSSDGITFTQIATVGPDKTSYSIYFLTPSTPYYYQLTAFNATGATSAPAVTATTNPPTPPASASALSGTVINSTQVNLSWTDNSLNGPVPEDGFKVYQSSDGVHFSSSGYFLGRGSTNTAVPKLS